MKPKSQAFRVVQIALLGLSLATSGRAQSLNGTQWIWGSWAKDLTRPSDEACWFRRTLDLGTVPTKAMLVVAADNRGEVWINGSPVVVCDDWMAPPSVDVAGKLRAGRNVICVRAANDGGPAGLAFALRLDSDAKPTVVSDRAWLTSSKETPRWLETDADESGWAPAREIAKFGGGPWGSVAAAPPQEPPAFDPPPGYTVTEIASGIGSIIACCRNDAGGVFVAIERGGVILLEDRDRDGVFETRTPWLTGGWSAQGLCWSKGHLFVNGRGPAGPGLYRVDGEGTARTPVLLGAYTGEMGEHGAHAIVEGPDDRLWVAVGNHVRIAGPISPDSPYRIAYEGNVVPPLPDPNGHAVGILAPGGVIASVDREGKEWRIISGGFRNTYDLAFTSDGACFTYDSDMEWDIGLPWYRPVRLCHAMPGAEFGWRNGSGKWPDWYPDSLGSVVDVGRGSPTGMATWDGPNVPQRFRGSILAGDWAQGRILAFFVRPTGASFTGDHEVLLSGRPLNVTDLVIDDNGDVLFTTGGRGTRGALFRLHAAAPDEKGRAPVAQAVPWKAPFDGSTPIEALLLGLDDADRATRFLAGRELERRDPAQWNPASRSWRTERQKFGAMIALARRSIGGASSPESWTETVALWQAPVTDATVASDAERLRFWELAAIHDKAIGVALGAPAIRSPDRRELVIEQAELRAMAEAWSSSLGTEGDPQAIDALLGMLDSLPSHEDQIRIAYCLRLLDRNWNDERARRFIRWHSVAATWSGGASFGGHLAAIRRDFASHIRPELRAELDKAIASATPSLRVELAAGSPKRDFDLTLKMLRRTLSAERRSTAEGALVFKRTCAACHRIGDIGTAVGPDLATVRARFSIDDQLVAVMEPSRTIADQYRPINVFRKDDPVVSGLVVGRTDAGIELLLPTGERTKIAREAIEEEKPSTVSVMPEGLLDGLTLEEIGDLFAFLNAGKPTPLPAATQWRTLFDGKTLDGWDGEPGLWTIEGSTIHGLANGQPLSTFLVSKESYRDFIAEFDVLLDEGNSGLQFRSKRDGFRVMGYQADVGEAYWGSLYEEGGRGMLHLAPPELWKPEVRLHRWNHYVVDARGSRIRVEVNGVVMSEMDDQNGAREGVFGFQLHARSTTSVHLRAIRVRTF